MLKRPGPRVPLRNFVVFPGRSPTKLELERYLVLVATQCFVRDEKDGRADKLCAAHCTGAAGSGAPTPESLSRAEIFDAPS